MRLYCEEARGGRSKQYGGLLLAVEFIIGSIMKDASELAKLYGIMCKHGDSTKLIY